MKNWSQKRHQDFSGDNLVKLKELSKRKFALCGSVAAGFVLRLGVAVKYLKNR